MNQEKRVILVADDSAVIRAVMKDILLEEGFEVLTAKNGLEVLEILESSAPDMLVLDLMMPEMDGVEVCREIRGREGQGMPHLPIVMVTALGDIKHLVEGLEAGADDYITKPPQSEELVARTKSLLRVKKLYDQIIENSTRLESLNKELERKNNEIEAQNLRLTQEMEIARRIQKMFIPVGSRDFGPIRIHCEYNPCEYIGGDYVDYYRADNGVIHLLLADVSGHGLPAAIVVSVVKSFFFNAARQGLNGPQFMTELEKIILNTTLDSQYITAWYLNFDPRTGRLKGLNAGHGALLYLPAGAAMSKWVTTLNPMIGIFKENSYTDVMDIIVTPGDRFLLFTDGITDQPGSTGELFSPERVKEIFEKTGDLSLDVGIKRIIAAAREYSKNRAFEDDVAFLGIEVAEESGKE